LDSFSNFHNSNHNHDANAHTVVLGEEEATSISFGGKSAKSRYLCVSDSSGIASVWDMKKGSRVRSFKIKHPMNGTTNSGGGGGKMDNHNNVASGKNHALGRPACIKSAMDPSDTHVVALHGSNPSFPIHRIALELFHLKSGSRVALLTTPEYQYGGGADCFEFSSIDDGSLLVGAKDGSLLLWDCTVSGITGHSTSKKQDYGPLAVLEKKHRGSISHVAYSPMNRVLAASCSMDGTVGFHDVGSKQTIQSIIPWDHCGKDVRLVESGKRGLSSLAFHHDGFTWAVGTESGIVFTYDLRQTGNGPLCTMIVSPSGEESVKILQFVQAKGGVSHENVGIMVGGNSGDGGLGNSTSSVKKKIVMDRDGVVTVEREKTTPSRKEISKTTYTVTKNEQQPPTSTTTATSSVSSFSNPSDAKTSSTRREKVTTSRVTTRKVVTSSPQRTASSVLKSPTSEQKVESTSTSESEIQTSSPQRPSTTTRVTKTKVSTSSSQNPTSYDFSSPPGTSVVKDLFANRSDGSEIKGKDDSKSHRHAHATSSKKESSVSFDDRVKNNIIPNDLSFDSNEKSEGSDKETEHMIEDFDAMYERIKKRALKKHNITSEDFIDDKDNLIDQDDDSGDGILPDTKASKFNGNDQQTRIQNSVRRKADDSLTLSVLQIQEMIDDSVESLRDDMEESMQALQLDFLKQMQKQTDEVTALLQEHRQEIIRLQMRNEYLEKENKRLSGMM
jgi:WD40 repeat protein